MVNTEITLIIFFVAEDGEAPYSQKKKKKKKKKPTTQNLELLVAQIMNSLLQNSGLN